MAAPTTTTRPALFRHPWRIAIVALVLVAVVNLLVVLGSQSDTQPQGRSLPSTIDSVSPEPGDIARPQDTITADLRDDLTGVLKIGRVGSPVQEIPEDQLERIVPLAEVSFRPGPGKDLTHLEPGVYNAQVDYWPQGKPRPARPGVYAWTFRVTA
jgi:hypothetical protein